MTSLKHHHQLSWVVTHMRLAARVHLFTGSIGSLDLLLASKWRHQFCNLAEAWQEPHSAGSLQPEIEIQDFEGPSKSLQRITPVNYF